MTRLFTVASDVTLCSMITSAKDRLVLVAPGISLAVAETLAERLASGNFPRELSVVLDVDPEVCRLGFGDIEAIECIQSALAARGFALHTQRGLRIGLAISDATILAYAPTPKIIESEPASDASPNAIRFAEFGIDGLARACGASAAGADATPREVGTEVVRGLDVEHAKLDLKENPPRQFDLARLERVFNYKLEFVEFSVEQYRLNTRSISLPAELLGLAGENLEARIRNSFRVFETGTPFEFKIPDPDDEKRELNVTEKWLGDEAAKIRKEYFISLGSSAYGNLILKRHKPEFEAKVARLRAIVERYAEQVRASIVAKIEATRNELVEALVPRVTAAPPSAWLKRSVDGRLAPEVLRQRVGEEVDRAFAPVKQFFQPKVTCVFKGVNYATITSDEHFRERIEAYFGQAEASKLLFEYDASRAQEGPSR